MTERESQQLFQKSPCPLLFSFILTDKTPLWQKICNTAQLAAVYSTVKGFLSSKLIL